MLTITSTSPVSKNSFDTFSSLEKVSIAYIPGKSTIFMSLPKKPSFLSIVTPGQLPTYWFEPVSKLKTVVLPTFGLPNKATLIII